MRTALLAQRQVPETDMLEECSQLQLARENHCLCDVRTHTHIASYLRMPHSTVVAMCRRKAMQQRNIVLFPHAHIYTQLQLPLCENIISTQHTSYIHKGEEGVIQLANRRMHS